MAPLCLFEPEGSEFLTADREAAWIIDKYGWGKFFYSFSGHNIKFTHEFSLSLKERVTHIGDLWLVLSKHYVAQATKLR